VNSLNFIELRNLYFEYKEENPIINNINLKIKKDEVTAILGPNGSGKTTLGKLIMGILRPTDGQVYISNKDILNMTLAQIGSKIGYLFQNPEKHFFSNTVEEELGFVLRLKGLNEDYVENQVEELLKLFQLEYLKKSSPLLISQGEKQRLAIAAILINDPEYLLLDEPTTGLDMERKDILIKVLKELNKKGIGMTIISHDHFFVEELFHRVINIHRGEIIYDQRI
jgi:energy-coupling factor transport system ATP-binding protein